MDEPRVYHISMDEFDKGAYKIWTDEFTKGWYIIPVKGEGYYIKDWMFKEDDPREICKTLDEALNYCMTSLAIMRDEYFDW